MLVVSIPTYIAITLAIGFWASKRIKTTEDFTLAGKSLSAGVVGVTIFATWFGPEFIMGIPGIFVRQGLSGIITDIFGNLICLALVGFFFAGRLYRMGLVTINDFFRNRYSQSLELVSSIIMVLTYFQWIAAQFLALALLFETVLGVSISTGVVLGAAIVVIYTYVGGMWAVSFTDLLQSILIAVGLLLLVVNILSETNGLLPILADKPAEFYSLLPAQDIHWTHYLYLWMAFGIGIIPAQEVYQRVFSAKSEKAAVRGVFLSGALLTGIAVIPLIIALGAVQLHPGILDLNDGQSLIPVMVSRYMGTPVQILFFGALISAILSTSSGAMLAPATIIGENLIKPYFPQLSDSILLLITRISVIAVAIVSVYLALDSGSIHNLVVDSALMTLICIVAPLTLGLYWKKANSMGAWLSMFSGALVYVIAVVLKTEAHPAVLGFSASVVAMIAGSMFSKR